MQATLFYFSKNEHLQNNMFLICIQPYQHDQTLLQYHQNRLSYPMVVFDHSLY